MSRYAICELKNGEFECIKIKNAEYDCNNGNVKFNYKATINKTIQQLAIDNKTRKEKHKIIKFVDYVQHESRIGSSDHSKWAKKCFEEAKSTICPIYDFEHPENGVEYY